MCKIKNKSDFFLEIILLPPFLHPLPKAFCCRPLSRPKPYLAAGCLSQAAKNTICFLYIPGFATGSLLRPQSRHTNSDIIFTGNYTLRRIQVLFVDWKKKNKPKKTHQCLAKNIDFTWMSCGHCKLNVSTTALVDDSPTASSSRLSFSSW